MLFFAELSNGDEDKGGGSSSSAPAAWSMPKSLRCLTMRLLEARLANASTNQTTLRPALPPL